MFDFLISVRTIDVLYLPAALAAALIAWSPTLKRPAPAAIAIMVSFLVGFLLVRPFPIWPPSGSDGWLPYIAVILLGLGLMADIPRLRLAASLLFVVFMPILVTYLMGRNSLGDFWTGRGLLVYPVIAISGAIIFSRIIVTGERRAGGLALLAPALGLVLLAEDYGTRIWLLILPLFAAILGAMIATIRLGRPWPVSASMVGGGIWFAFAALLIARRDILALPTAILFLGFLLPELADQLAPRRSMVHFAIMLAGGAVIVIISRASFSFG